MQCTIMFNRKIALLLCSFCLNFSVHSEEQWVLEKSRGHIEVLSRHVSFNGMVLREKEIWAKTVVKASSTALVLLLDDINQAPYWIDKCISVKLIEGGDLPNRIVQSTFSAPWPMQNRDMVTKSTTHIAGDSLFIQVSDVGSLYPKQRNTVRMTHIQGQWQVKKIAAQLIEISYQGRGKPSGNVPLWLANKVLIDSTFTTFLQLSEIITEAKYQAPLITP